jgi:hypothetical protein
MFTIDDNIPAPKHTTKKTPMRAALEEVKPGQSVEFTFDSKKDWQARYQLIRAAWGSGKRVLVYRRTDDGAVDSWPQTFRFWRLK